MAKEVVALNPDKPKASEVAVVGDRIPAVGTLKELKKAAGDQPYTVDNTFADKVIVPGFIAQHDHPFLAAMAMISDITSIKDWVLPHDTMPAARNQEEYRQRLKETDARLKDPNELLFGRGFHADFHGKLTRADHMVRIGDVERAGISVSFHADLPIAPVQPLFLMDSAVNNTGDVVETGTAYDAEHYIKESEPRL